VGGVVDAIEDGVTGYLVEPANIHMLVEKIDVLLKNDKQRIVMGESGYNRIIKKFTWPQIVCDIRNFCIRHI
jgi:glycosyltransferase involved in cell wall biosynthesis